MSNDRNKDLSLIHIAKKQLGLDDDTYRNMLWTLCRVRSAGDLRTSADREKVIQHLKNCGFKPAKSKVQKAKPGDHGTPPHNLRTNPQMQKIEALLADAQRPWQYAEAMARGMYRKDRLEFCDPGELSGIIAALVKDQQRRRAG